MSEKSAQKFCPLSMPNSTETTAPTEKQVVTTLRFCLRYAQDGANVFTRLLKILETADLVALTSKLPEDERHRFVLMIAARLPTMRLHLSDVVKLKCLCQANGVSTLPLIRNCDLAPPKSDRNDGSRSGQFLGLGELLPHLEVLNMQAAIAIPFPDNLRQLRTLIVHQSIFDSMLKHICEKCPLLQELYLRNESHPHTILDIACVVKLNLLRRMQLPLMLQSPTSIGPLEHLKHLTLQRQQVWPDMDWLSTVREIIRTKRNELQRLSCDGTWLARPLDLSLLQLHMCWALKELRLSNCNLADLGNDRLTLPFSCERFSLQECTLDRIEFYLRGCPQLQVLELFKCHLTGNDGKLLVELLKQRRQLPILHPLQLRFSASSLLRLELVSWNQGERQLWEEWLHVQEVCENEMTWKLQVGTINMTFGKPLNFPPDLEQLM